MQKLKKFKIKPKKKEKRSCQICEKTFDKLCSIRIITNDNKRHYVGSGYPILNSYRINCCQKCFKIIIKKIEQKLLPLKH